MSATIVNQTRRSGLLGCWTTRYLATLLVGLVAIGIGTAYWMEYTYDRHQIAIMETITTEITQMAREAEGGRVDIGPPGQFALWLEKQKERFNQNPLQMLFIVDRQGEIIYRRPEVVPRDVQSYLMEDVGVRIAEPRVSRYRLGQPDNKSEFIMVARNLANDRGVYGHVYMLLGAKNFFKSKEEMQLLFVLLSAAAVFGLVVIYMLARALVKPVTTVTDAAKQIVSGNYDVKLDVGGRQREVYELLESFGEMAERLKQLEYLRTRLLAGVTHELRTPVSSVSGILQALRDGVVKDDEARYFIEVGVSESLRLQRMVDDLLDFNSFAVGAINVMLESTDLCELVREVVQQWRLTPGDGAADLSVRLSLPDKPLYVVTDGARLQQVLFNLFNNARAAMKTEGELTVAAFAERSRIYIEVADNGGGIPEREQPFVFENFFRGEGKQKKVRGMGLGLPLSRQIMKALGGSLSLKESSPAGTTFALSLPAERAQHE